MKFIHKYKSPNFNQRVKGAKINYIIIHYTAMTSSEEAISHLCSKKNKVSAHFLINKQGNIYNLVNLQNRAWHAGESTFEGRNSCNEFSIGIELIGSVKEEFTSEQYSALKNLLNLLKNEYGDMSVVGHSEIAPKRKNDPGPYFNWDLINA